MKNLLLLLMAIAFLSTKIYSQVCPTVINPNQYNQTTNLGGGGENPTLNPFTYSYTAGAGSNRLMILFITYETENVNGPNNFSTVTYGGKTLTSAVNLTVTAAGTQQNRLAIYYLKEVNIAGAVGTTVSITFTNPGGASPNGSINGVAVSTIMLENVNQTTPLVNIQSAVSTSTMTIMVPSALPATAGNFIIAAVNMALATATVGPSTPAYTVFISQQVTGSHTHAVSYKKITVSANEKPGFTANTTTRQIIGSIEVQSAGTTGPCNRVLPVRLSSFTGNLFNNTVRLNWKAEIEYDIQSYRIQRSDDAAGSFATIGEINARNLSPSSYSFIDANINFTNAFYRLQILNIDGSITYSNIIRIEISKEHKPTTVATLFNSTITIYTTSVNNQDGVIYLTDAIGKKILQKNILLQTGYNSLQYSVNENIPRGMYFLTLQTGNSKEVFKMVKE